jgi:hypothetical protein
MMNANLILYRLQRFLLGLSGFLFAGTLVELAFRNHTRELVQLIPFVLCTLGLLAIGLVLARPQPRTLLALRVWMGVTVLGSLVGLYEHVANNIGFQLEVSPGSTTAQLIAAALRGASPLLAPGILVVAAVLALAATYAYPAVRGMALNPSAVEG